MPMTPTLPPELVDEVVSATFASYATLYFRPQPGKFTILASFVLLQHSGLPDTTRIEVISLGTGSKCLPENRLAASGDALHDSHAEVMARRGAIRWLAREVLRDTVAHVAHEKATETLQDMSVSRCRSLWIRRESHGQGKYRLRDGVSLLLYVSTVPCKVRIPYEMSNVVDLSSHRSFSTWSDCIFRRRRCVYSPISVPPRPQHGLPQGRHLLACPLLRHPVQRPR